MSSVVATLLNLGWTPLEPDKWKSLADDWWTFTGDTFTNILDTRAPFTWSGQILVQHLAPSTGYSDVEPVLLSSCPRGSFC